MSLEQQIRDAYKTTLGRDVDSDGSLGYWMNQGDNWQSAFNKAAAAELAARPSNTNYPTLTGTQTQQQKQITDSAQQLYGRTADQLTAAGQGYGTGIGLHPGEGAADPNYMAYKSYNDDMQKRLNEAGRTAATADAAYRSAAAYDPQTGKMVIRDKNGANLTQWTNGGLMGSDWATLDRLGVDPASLKAAAAQMRQAGNPEADNYWHSANNYKPLYASAADAGMLRQGIDPAVDASPLMGGSNRPNLKEFMDKTGLGVEAASGLLYGNELGSVGAGLVDWDKVMASPDPTRALNAAYAAIAADPRLAGLASQAASGNYAGWNINGVGVTDGAAGGGAGGGAGGAAGGAGGGSSGSGAWQTGATGPSVDRAVDARTETIEGRIQNLLGTDASGNYTNPVVQQAANRALQQFSGRGLLNSSMAQQAAIEAATSKAIEIAGPDAQTYFSQGRANQDALNVFERDARGYANSNMQQDKQLAAERERLQQADSQFSQELKYKYDAFGLEAGSRAEAEKRAHQNALEINNISAVNSAYDLYLRRISDIDSNQNYDAPTKVKMKNEAGRDFDLYAKAKKISWEMSLGDRFATAAEEDKKAGGMLAQGASGGDGAASGGGMFA